MIHRVEALFIPTMKKAMPGVRPKKFLGQHFLKDQNIAQKIVESLGGHGDYRHVLEVGPGTGVLTQFLIQQSQYQTTVIEVDDESVAYLKQQYPALPILHQDFLKTNLAEQPSPLAIIGNFPYNISSQIFFKVLDHRNSVPEVVGMIQKEVGDRICSPPGSKVYGILSVLLQAYYNIEYLFTVEPQVFHPPPKVRSAVIRLQRNSVSQLPCSETLFRRIVKQGFQNRRKTLRNALKPLNLPEPIRQLPMLNLRAEQLSVNDFVQLTQQIEPSWKP
ncbi:16S rRNA (adenine(1518)-N(6)/adenine(1519)-N(6))-dimethyltransferase RsmA [Tunicatimonas pelagia]|uniref:16S rRNA (adenine(1518)-N(6)/adenine(1519)-N(6))- dimethyltransferase RsmA n=1 Tax=Tunicatimonas pelagia TaxID=931531 RepID=UPI00266676B5|nr:16S rRNA (adenine(1518)-N(6)/adenine(1519)-N(6))-dimethyltransferase RsmA [Tunicatimonas pelagia]WKN44470.1 16S rRNA (adenine(1518)-N(6)/adenine(1519)-N(6))-dimethyltransferase RsmA [Tunicatimonas pelagia]